MSDNLAQPRPTSVTVAVVLVYISAALAIIGGIALILARNNEEVEGASGGPTAVLVSGIFLLVVGIITALVARGLARGNNGTRIFVTVLQVLQLIGGIYALTQPAQRAGSGGGIIGALIVLALLWNPAANRFFSRR
jgi:hypothetical protein